MCVHMVHNRSNQNAELQWKLLMYACDRNDSKSTYMFLQTSTIINLIIWSGYNVLELATLLEPTLFKTSKYIRKKI